jgi:nucleoside-diphosphate-sugar epimerase
MHVLVTGAGGFVGAHVALRLVEVGHTVTGVWHSNGVRVPALEQAGVAARQADLVEAASVAGLFEEAGNVEAVVHAAAVVAGTEGTAFLRRAAEVNVLATANVIAAAKDHRIQRFVLTSTISVYGGRGAGVEGYREEDARPASYYGWSKLAGEGLLDVAAQRAGWSAVSLRLAGVHGIGRETGALHAMASNALAGSRIEVREPDSRFRWCFIDDVGQAVELSLSVDLPSAHVVANLASRDVFSLANVATQLVRLTGSESLVATATGGPSRHEVMNIDRLCTLIDFAPTSLAEFLPSYLDRLRGA